MNILLNLYAFILFKIKWNKQKNCVKQLIYRNLLAINSSISLIKRKYWKLKWWMYKTTMFVNTWHVSKRNILLLQLTTICLSLFLFRPFCKKLHHVFHFHTSKYLHKRIDPYMNLSLIWYTITYSKKRICTIDTFTFIIFYFIFTEERVL